MFSNKIICCTPNSPIIVMTKGRGFFSFYILGLILPCKYDCIPIFGIIQYVTEFIHVFRHFGA